MSTTVRTTARLLLPQARPHVLALLAVVLFGALSALGQRSVVLLLVPTLRSLFPEGQVAVVEEPAPAPGSEAAEAAPPEVAPEAGGWSFDAAQARLWEWLSAGAVDDEGRLQVLWRIGLCVVVIALLTAVAQYLFTTILRRVALDVVVDLRMRIARHLMGLSMGYHGRRQFGDLLSRISSDVTTTLNVLNLSLKDLIQEPLLALSSLALAAWIAPLPTLVVVAGLVAIAVPVTKLSRRVRKGSSRSLTSLGSSVQALTQMFQGIRAVKAFRAEERELERYREANATYVRQTMRMVRALALSNASTLFLSYAGLGVMLIVTGWLMIRGGVFADAGQMATFFLLVSGVYGSVKAVTKAVTSAQESVGASERLLALLDERPDVVERPGAVPLAGLGEGIVIAGVSYRYADGDGNAVEDIDLVVRPGETLALVGPSGSGKSTLVDLIARFMDPTAGTIRVGGRDLRDVTLDSWVAQYAMVGQTPFLFHTTIEENIRYGRPEATRAEVEEAARMAGIHDFIASLPQGYATDVADAGSRLSGGQRQRITIARAFLKGAPLLLLDEATSALDSESEAQVQEALERLMSQRTVIVIAHRLSTIRNADRIVVLEAGRIVEIGRNEELLAQNGAYARLHAT